MLRILFLANFLDLFIHPKKDHFDAALERTAFLQQRRQSGTRPFHIADGAHETCPAAVAGTFERGGDGCRLACFKLAQRKSARLVYETRDLQLPFGGIEFRDTVMLDMEDLLLGRDPARKLLPAQHFGGRLLVQKWEHNLRRFRISKAKEAEWSFSKRECRKRDAATNHLPPADGLGLVHGFCV